MGGFKSTKLAQNIFSKCENIFSVRVLFLSAGLPMAGGCVVLCIFFNIANKLCH